MQVKPLSNERANEQTLDGCRRVYNYFLSLPSPISKYDMTYALTGLKEQHPCLRNYRSETLQMVCKQVWAAIRAVGVRKKNLLYRKHDYLDSFTYKQSGFRLGDNNKRLSLSKVKGAGIRIVLHKKPLKIKQVRICRKNPKWYAIIACEVLRRIFSSIIRYRRKQVGIAAGITNISHVSNVDARDKSPKPITEMLNPMKRAHRRVSRRQLGSSNYGKAKHMLAKLYESIHNKRKAFPNKKAAHSASGYSQIISLERLQATNPNKSHISGYKILDASWGTFCGALQYKDNHIVDEKITYSSTDCSKCGYRHLPKSLAVTIHLCVKCRIVVLDRDYKAPLYIQHPRIGSLTTLLKLVQVERREVMPAEIAM